MFNLQLGYLNFFFSIPHVQPGYGFNGIHIFKFSVKFLVIEEVYVRCSCIWTWRFTFITIKIGEWAWDFKLSMKNGLQAWKLNPNFPMCIKIQRKLFEQQKAKSFFEIVRRMETFNWITPIWRMTITLDVPRIDSRDAVHRIELLSLCYYGWMISAKYLLRDMFVDLEIVQLSDNVHSEFTFTFHPRNELMRDM